jgi:hypothetical protein
LLGLLSSIVYPSCFPNKARTAQKPLPGSLAEPESAIAFIFACKFARTPVCQRLRQNADQLDQAINEGSDKQGKD